MKYKFVEDSCSDVVELDFPEGTVATDYSNASVDYEFTHGGIILSINKQIFRKEDFADIIEVFEAMKEKLS